ncbi:hypothetical protein Athai_03660 [Actinocatenispora thailandica]|uniref:Uncharacterized protein n=1 Tax=Actinocatenispora thailandica TaxID=227318 RepID=A0A7R7DJR4_9ACTN|nr:hypothetical protein [Actinocatenispora thailandica]BCJ32863.1 hypothetical protein Athai_03660 [Actinocatenispora thailandica]
MDEDDIKDVLRRALPDQLPPGALDRARLVRDGRRLRRRRAVGLGGTGVAAVAAVATVVGVAALQPGSDGRQAVPAGPRATVRHTPGPDRAGTASPRPSHQQSAESTGQRVTRLTDEVKSVLGKLVPGASYSVRSYPAPTNEFPPLQLIQRQHTWYEAKALLTTKAGTGSIDIGIMPAAGTDAVQVAGCATPGPPRYQKGTFACETRHSQGLSVTVRTERNPNGALIIHVATRLDPATVVSVEVSNIDPNDVPPEKFPNAPTPRAKQPAVSADQAVALATDPGLSLA